MEALGRLLNVVPTADAVWISLADAESVTFVCVNADTYTVQDASDAAGTGAASLSAVDNFWTNANALGTAAWVAALQAKAATVVIAAGVAVFTVDGAALRDGMDYVRVSSAAAGLVVAITHDLHPQRKPSNLPALAV